MRIKTYRNVVRSPAAVASVGTAFDTAKRITLDFNFWPSGAPFIGSIASVTVHLSSIATASSLVWRLTRDTAGDEMLVTDTTGAIFNGVTTASDGSLNFKLDFNVALETGSLMYFWAKVDAGTVTVDQVVVLWEE